MVISGKSSNYFGALPQFNWSAQVSPIDTTGDFSLYFQSGVGVGYSAFRLKNSQILSPDNLLIGSYSAGDIVNFSGNYFNGYADLYKNGNPLYLGYSVNTSGSPISQVILDCENGSRTNLLNFTLIADTPNVQVGQFNNTYSGNVAPFYILNNSNSVLTINSISSNNNSFIYTGNNLPYSINSSQSGVFYLVYTASTGFLPASQIIPLSINTSAGTYSYNLNLLSQSGVDNYSYVYVSNPIPSIADGKSSVFNILYRNANDSSVSIYLDYISGFTGDYYAPVRWSNRASGQLISGFLSGSGYINQAVTGLISGFNNLLSAYQYTTGYGIFSGLSIAPNQPVSQIVSVLTTGLGNVNIVENINGSGYYSGNILYSGYVSALGGSLTGYVTGLNILGTGQILGVNATGYLLSGISILQTGFANNTGSVSASFGPNDLQTLNYISPLIFVTGNFVSNIDIVAYGYATGQIKTGILVGDFGNVYDPGVYTFTKNVSGVAYGKQEVLQLFDPINIRATTADTTGFLTGTVSKIIETTCDNDFSWKYSLSGYPSYINLADASQPPFFWTGFSYNNLPTQTTEFIFENSDYVYNYLVKGINTGLNGYYPTIPGARTRISRLGNSIDGSGMFDNVIQTPGFNGAIRVGQTGDLLYSWGTGFYGWKESVQPVYTSYYVDGSTPKISMISGGFDLYSTNKNDNCVLYLNATGQSGYIYPTYLSFKSESPNNLINVDFYQNISGSYKYISSTSGGYYINYNGQQIGQPWFVNEYNVSGGNNYAFVTTYKYIPTNYVNSQINWSHSYYTGCEYDGYISMLVERTGYAGYEISGSATCNFVGNNLPVVPVDILKNGLSWSFYFNSGEVAKYLCIYLYRNTYYQDDWMGALSLNLDISNIYFTDPFNVPLVSSTLSNSVFVVKDDDFPGSSCTRTVFANSCIYINESADNSDISGPDFPPVQNCSSCPAYPPQPPSISPPGAPSLARQAGAKSGGSSGGGAGGGSSGGSGGSAPPNADTNPQGDDAGQSDGGGVAPSNIPLQMPNPVITVETVRVASAPKCLFCDDGHNILNTNVYKLKITAKLAGYLKDSNTYICKIYVGGPKASGGRIASLDELSALKSYGTFELKVGNSKVLISDHPYPNDPNSVLNCINSSQSPIYNAQNLTFFFVVMGGNIPELLPNPVNIGGFSPFILYSTCGVTPGYRMPIPTCTPTPTPTAS
jgi:hypothetical protein